MTLVEQLLKSSLLCGLKPGGAPTSRLQLFMVAYKELAARSRETDFQRALESGVDVHRFWVNHPFLSSRGHGEYQITQHGFTTANRLFPGLRPIYTPRSNGDFVCALRGTIGGKRIVLDTKGYEIEIPI